MVCDYVDEQWEEFQKMSLNPCFNGLWSATERRWFWRSAILTSLNPCFNGIWSATYS